MDFQKRRVQLLVFIIVIIALSITARGFNHKYYQPLHIAILKGDWVSTNAFIDNDPSALTAKITMFSETALHVAALGGQWQLVEKLVQLMPALVLGEQDLKGRTCLHYVALGESTKTARALVAKNPSLTQIVDSDGFAPITYSSTRCKEMVWYLVLNTTDETPGCPFSGPSAGDLVSRLTYSGFHDITMYLLQRYHNLATTSFPLGGSVILFALSGMPSEFPSGQNLGFWGRCIYHCVPAELDYLPPSQLREDLKDSYFGVTIWNAILNLVPGIKLVRDAKLRHVSAMRLVDFVCSQVSTMNDSEFWQSFVDAAVILNATSFGIVEILSICFHFFPDLIGTRIPNEGSVAHIAIKYRQEKVLSLLCKMPIIVKILVMRSYNIESTSSHLAARFASHKVASISGAAFQMQKELQWFKEVEKLDYPAHKEFKNKDGKTPWQLFREEHKTLLEEGEKWMKDTSNSCMLVATLIATVVFAALLTVPGGNSQNKGIPIFLQDRTFMVFAVSDAFALFSSIASLLMFLSILTARYAEEDFLKTLPQRLIFGLAFLFFAIVTSMTAFGAALSLVLRERLKWESIPIALLVCVPVVLFGKLHLPLFIQMIKSTYGSLLHRPRNVWS